MKLCRSVFTVLCLSIICYLVSKVHNGASGKEDRSQHNELQLTKDNLDIALVHAKFLLNPVDTWHA